MVSIIILSQFYILNRLALFIYACMYFSMYLCLKNLQREKKSNQHSVAIFGVLLPPAGKPRAHAKPTSHPHRVSSWIQWTNMAVRLINLLPSNLKYEVFQLSHTKLWLWSG